MPTRLDQQHFAQAFVEQARSEGVQLIGPGGLLTGLTKTVLETALEAEITDHLGYDKHDPMGRNGDNSPQRHTLQDRAHREIGSVQIEVPRDRDGTFEPGIVHKRPTPPGRGGSDHPVALGARVDDRRDRPLDRVYPLTFIDAIMVKVRDVRSPIGRRTSRSG